MEKVALKESVGSTALTKFRDPDVTVKGEPRAFVRFERLDTLWFNTGTLCNIECRNCYIESSPSNDRLAYLSAAEVGRFLDEVDDLALPTREVGFTGGEPFMNPELLEMVEGALVRGLEVLILTNAMQPMMRPHIQEGLVRLRGMHLDRLKLRVSLDHFTQSLHDTERGQGSWERALEGTRWLAANSFKLTVAGRTCWGEDEARARAGYQRLFSAEDLPVDAADPEALVLFPEMDPTAEVPEISVHCWETLGVDPRAIMCASGRMVVKRKGATNPAVVACTLLPYDRRFELGDTLEESLGTVKLNHPYCAMFCVLGGGCCSAASG
ncbi:MAG: radical SAM protein [Acidobacteria bacterium]|nr:radical SAM protein [Acidobacteriota bacterium]